MQLITQHFTLSIKTEKFHIQIIQDDETIMMNIYTIKVCIEISPMKIFTCDR